jgi:hypothetical protein
MAASTADPHDTELLARLHRNDLRESLLHTLRSHAFPLSAAEVLLIQGTDDEDVLHRWVDRATAATFLDDVFLPAEIAASRRERPGHASSASLRQRSNTLHSIIRACLVHDCDCGCLCETPRPDEKQCTDVYVFRRSRTPGHKTFDEVDGVELLFELVDSSHPRDIDAVARKQIARGLRRVICIFVHEGAVREWSPEEEAWRVLDPAGMISDPVLSVPIPIATLLAPTNEEIVGAWRLGTKRWLAIKDEDEAEAAATRAEHRKWWRKLRNACITVFDELCVHSGVSMTTKERARMEELDPDDLVLLFDEALATRRIPAWLGLQAEAESSEP